MHDSQSLCFILIVAAWIAESFLVASYARMSGRPYRVGLLLSLLLNPIIGAVAMLLWKRSPKWAPAPVDNPAANQMNQISAWTAGAGCALLALAVVGGLYAASYPSAYMILMLGVGAAMGLSILLEIVALVCGICASRAGARSGGLLLSLGMLLLFLSLMGQGILMRESTLPQQGAIPVVGP